MSNDFLPKGYEVPDKGGNYMKFHEGENRFRILCKPILGYESWETQADGSRKPLRRPLDKPFSTIEVEDPETIKHFWAMAVWNYEDEKVQILEITQKGLQKKIMTYIRDEDYGSCLNYDLVVTREGKDLNTKYDVMAKIPKKIDEGIVAMYEGMKINLEALYEGADPFSDTSSDKIAEEVDKALG